MGRRVLAVVETGPGGVERRSAAALGVAQRTITESRGEGDVLVVGPAVALTGRWAQAWHVPAADAVALAGTVTSLAEAGAYNLIAIGDTPLGRELAGRLAVRTGFPIATSVLGLRERDGVLQASRPALAGTRTATLALRAPTTIALVNAEAAGDATGTPALPEFTGLAPVASASPFALVQESRLSPWEMDLAEADVVVAGGRGLGSREGFDLLAELAGLLGGTVGASRVAVDNGWIPSARQVGLTGRTVTPALYIACGISGAIHHTLGMRGASFIVAINSDARAPIFKIANVSLVGDVHEILPALIADLRGRRSSSDRRAAVAGAAG
ncbi:MAG: electron transfer flavoprotein subunit alpha/FixB family protein [Chloroflexi bacterium]|nr:electron transfer flavoprotein subunit alpha/FixB family protein [Chloroflexota bacterium]